MGEPKCYRCGKPISFDSKIKSKTGKYIPLDPNTKTPHYCSESAFDSSISSIPKPTIKKRVTFAIASVIAVIIVIAGIGGFLANLDNNHDKNNMQQSGIMESQNQEIKSGSPNSDNARYFTGKVTGIVDGDTIKVDSRSVRLALASTPELNQPMGQAAKKYIQEICPMGSTVAVDEDNGQTQGSYGRIVAKVTCNGVNLNQAIMDKGYGHLSFAYCDKSEFSGEAWSGCGSSQQKSAYTSSYSGSSSNCDPNYSGVCIPKGSRDLDCADIGGSVRVSGSDPHGLDRDGDGIGCE